MRERKMNRRRRESLLMLGVTMVIFTSAQASGKVVVSCHDIGGGVAELRYDASGESVLVGAFALDITVDGGSTIESLFDYMVGESTSEDPGYGIFPGRFREFIDPDNPNWNHPDYNPLAWPDDPGALPGLGTYGITIEMGSLYEGAENAPLVSDTLLRFAIDWHSALAVNVEISLNELRGGVVMEDASPADVDLVGCVLVPEPGTILLLGLGAVMINKKAKSNPRQRHARTGK
ncbi:MAG: PEP-CTERM sorting domain-containing protein [Sedimentisphaerales bacterium]|nr:PEP-CTERM sorting domain-containing protein [Sedimentisphaerales bacterium]